MEIIQALIRLKEMVLEDCSKPISDLHVLELLNNISIKKVVSFDFVTAKLVKISARFYPNL